MPRPIDEAARKKRHNQILDAVERVIAADGLAALTMQRIIRDSGLSAGSVYHHFDGKDQILAALIDRQDEGTQELIDALALGYPVREVLKASARELLAYLCDPPKARLAVELSIGARAGAPWAQALRAQDVRLAEALSGAIRADVAARRLSRKLDPDIATRMILAIWTGLVSLSSAGPMGAPKDVQRHYLDAVLGVLKR